jgi:hypothetical protein
MLGVNQYRCAVCGVQEVYSGLCMIDRAVLHIIFVISVISDNRCMLCLLYWICRSELVSKVLFLDLSGTIMSKQKGQREKSMFKLHYCLSRRSDVMSKGEKSIRKVNVQVVLMSFWNNDVCVSYCYGFSSQGWPCKIDGSNNEIEWVYL